MPTPEEAYAIILADAEAPGRQEFAKKIVAEKRAVDPTLPDAAKRSRIQNEMRRKFGYRQHELNILLNELHDELHDVGIIRNPRANR